MYIKFICNVFLELSDVKMIIWVSKTLSKCLTNSLELTLETLDYCRKRLVIWISFMDLKVKIIYDVFMVKNYINIFRIKVFNPFLSSNLVLDTENEELKY